MFVYGFTYSGFSTGLHLFPYNTKPIFYVKVLFQTNSCNLFTAEKNINGGEVKLAQKDVA